MKSEEEVKDQEDRPFWERFRRRFMIILASVGTFLAFNLRVYSIWSKTYQRIWHKRFSDPDHEDYSPLMEDLSPIEAQDYMDLVEWRPDRILELWDAFGSPHWFQFLLDRVKALEDQPPGANDCDEYAIWAANVVSEDWSPLILTATWVSERKPERGKDGKTRFPISGHNVCVIQRRLDDGRTEFRHIGNWGMSRAHFTPTSLLLDLPLRAQGENRLARWAVWDKDLRLLETGRDPNKIKLWRAKDYSLL